MLHPTVRRPWAPQGQTPIPESWDRHDRLSVTGVSTLSPVRQRLGLSLSLASHHLPGDDILALAQQLHGHRKRPWLLIGARWSGHRQATRLLQAMDSTRIPIESLPAYAPELHAVELCGSHTKYGEMANFIPQHVEHLADEVAHALVAKHRCPDLLHAFLQHARLDL